MADSPELTEVETPFLEQLSGLGWEVIVGDRFNPTVTERTSFRQVVLEDRLLAALRRLNQLPQEIADQARNDQEWESRLAEGVPALTRMATMKLIEANEAATNLLLEGLSVAGLPGWDQGRNQRLQYIDFERPERNDFLAISQFRVDEPGSTAHKYVVPDIVLFVNGVPLVVVECKSPYVTDPMAEGVDQLRRYANQRGYHEGNEQLFWTNQFVVATCDEAARASTFTGGPEHYLEWRDPYPLTQEALAESLGKNPADLTGQELLVAGMLTPANLLDIVRHFTLFAEVNGRRVKVVAHYQQYRAVGKALVRLRTGPTREQDGENDRRGGLIWHTQGSGKSLTMVFLVRAMRSYHDLQAFKVVAVTDRTDLEKQLSATAKLSGETVRRARRVRQLSGLLSEHGPGLVFAMIQKYQDPDAVGSAYDGLGREEAEPLGVLNSDETILVLVDEAHRSQTSVLHANLMAALPNAAKIGFTGTPIMRADKKRTTDIFGSFLDVYTIRDAEADGTVVPILYEGKTAKGAVSGGSDLDELFEDMFAEHAPEELEVLKQRYATTGSVLEAPELIAAKAKSMILHYVSTVMPGGFKAQVAASSRLAAVRYRDALVEARDALVAEIEGLSEDMREASATDRIDGLPLRTQLLARARPNLDAIKGLEFATVISGSHNDPPDWAEWSDKAQQDAAIARFKKPLGPEAEKSSPLAFLIVRTMLLTGFDAPVEQVLYLDRFAQDAELLQAIARVNRTSEGKPFGLVVDYFGVGSHLQQALASYAAEDAADTIGALTSVKEEVPKLRDRHARVAAIFAQAGIDTFDSEDDVDACVEVLEDQALRARFGALLKQFLTLLDMIMPRPEALPFVKDAKQFGLIQRKAACHYRDDGLEGFDPSLYGAKVRELIDEHIIALDIETKITPVSITDPDFFARVSGLTSAKTKASEMEHALRYHIRKNFDVDPARYAKLSKRLEDILASLRGKWEQLALALESMASEVAAQDSGDKQDSLIERFLGVLLEEYGSADVPPPVYADIVYLSEKVVVEFTGRAKMVRFWKNGQAQADLRNNLIRLIDSRDIYPLEEQEAIADRLMDLGRANRRLIAKAGAAA
ncbi:MAG: HsdR family type I site-specific deoxyribonuclease [Propionibacteriaceae bacterium]|jgi:type I restriction enzyme R subunit|nr:HsdR family type I site-specific deoxyribonuclease [Propionibacteriaceae bacterium]